MNSEILNYPIGKFLDASLMGQMIGHEGINIYKIEKENKVIVNILRNENAESIVRITGQYWNLKLALNDLCTLIAKIRNNNRRYTFEIPTYDVGFLIGKNGAKINEIKLSSNVEVQFDREKADEGNTKVTVIGNYQQILTALRLISDRLNSKGQKSLYENPRTKQFAESLMECF